MSASDAHTILVVDDDDALAEMIGLVLAQEGFNAVSAKMAAALLKLLCAPLPIWCFWI